MSRQSSITLAGVDLGGDRSFDWELRAGSAPVERVWTITAKRARALYPYLGTPCDLVIRGPRKTLTVQYVYPLEILPGPNPNLKRVRVADRRWLWPRVQVSFTCNVRLATGTTFLVNDSGLIENAVLQPDIRYKQSSLWPVGAPSLPWNGYRLLESIFLGQGGLGTPLEIRGTFDTFEVQDQRFADPGDAAVDRALAYLAGADVFIDYDGKAIVYDTLKDDGRGVLPRLARKQVTGADIELLQRHEIAPRAFFVMFTPEVECRVNYTETGSRERNTNAFFSVAPSPDPTLTLTNGKKVGRNTLVDQSTLFETWGAFGFLSRALSFETLAGLGYASNVLEQVYANAPNEPFDPIAAARIRSAVQHWRRLFQIDEQFMGRLESVRAVRAAVMNTETGARAPSPVYCDYTRKPATRGHAKSIDDLNKQSGWAVRGYADRLEDGHVAPASASVLDPQLGIVRVEPQLDPWGFANAIMLGYPERGFCPTQTGEADANRTGDDAYAQWLAGPMEAAFELATILTVVPAVPNDNRRFHTVEVDASKFGLLGNGPPVYIRVFPGVMTARFAWSDDQSTEIVSALKGDGAIPGNLLVNAEDVQAVADASARRAAEAWLPRLSGSADVDMDPELRPGGPIGSVRHALVGGATVTRVSATGVRTPADIWAYLPAATRQFTLRVPLEGGL